MAPSKRIKAAGRNRTSSVTSPSIASITNSTKSSRKATKTKQASAYSLLDKQVLSAVYALTRQGQNRSTTPSSLHQIVDFLTTRAELRPATHRVVRCSVINSTLVQLSKTGLVSLVRSHVDKETSDLEFDQFALTNSVSHGIEEFVQRENGERQDDTKLTDSADIVEAAVCRYLDSNPVVIPPSAPFSPASKSAMEAVRPDPSSVIKGPILSINESDTEIEAAGAPEEGTVVGKDNRGDAAQFGHGRVAREAEGFQSSCEPSLDPQLIPNVDVEPKVDLSLTAIAKTPVSPAPDPTSLLNELAGTLLDLSTGPPSAHISSTTTNAKTQPAVGVQASTQTGEMPELVQARQLLRELWHRVQVAEQEKREIQLAAEAMKKAGVETQEASERKFFDLLVGVQRLQEELSSVKQGYGNLSKSNEAFRDHVSRLELSAANSQVHSEQLTSDLSVSKTHLDSIHTALWTLYHRRTSTSAWSPDGADSCALTSLDLIDILREEMEEKDSLLAQAEGELRRVEEVVRSAEDEVGLQPKDGGGVVRLEVADRLEMLLSVVREEANSRRDSGYGLSFR